MTTETGPKRRRAAGAAGPARTTRRAAGAPAEPLLSSTEPGFDPLWYKDAVIYEVHVRAFFDSNGDGIGDFRGLTSKLDYLADLGVTAIWILPFYPSPLRDDGYDIADYTKVNPDYGTLRDVKTLIHEAHERGLRVITELVCNHTSDQHPWFQRARRAPKGSPWRDWYVWSDDPTRYADARIIFTDTETSNWAWDPIANSYYWHRFFSHQPDLNFDNEQVQQAVFEAMDFWLEMGVDGLRLDAIPYLYEREGTNCENLPETHAFLKRLRARIDERYAGRMLLAEANQWPEDSVKYFGNGDECHMCFHFPVMPRMFMALRMEDRFPIIDILGQTPPIPETNQWAMFLRNHDELTLEMVTDEERDFMYRVYAEDPQMRINVGIRRRLAPLLGNNRRRIELMEGLLFSLPGTPVMYYGDEIGMGDNVYLGDRNGVRTPMQWSGDRNAGFSQANRQALYFPVITDPEYHYEAVNVEVQQSNPQSLLWWMKRLIALRRQHPAFGRGSLEFIQPDNRKVLAFIRRDADEQILVVANLSRFSQPAELDLSTLAGLVPVEMFGRVEFPAIGEQPYVLTLAPHAFHWFLLEERRAEAPVAAEAEPPVLRAGEAWETVLREPGGALGRILPRYLPPRRWFRGKAREIASATIRDTVPITADGRDAVVALVEVGYHDAEPELYALPLTFVTGRDADRALADHPAGVVARMTAAGNRPAGLLVDATGEPTFASAVLDAIARRRRLRGAHGEITASPTSDFRRLRGPAADEPTPSLSRLEQSNTSIVFGDRLILKLFRRLEDGLNPDLEIGLFLSDRHFPNVPAVAGWLAYRGDSGEPSAVGILQQFVPNEGDLWGVTLDALRGFLDRAITDSEPPGHVDASTRGLLALAAAEAPPRARTMIEPYLETARLVGQRTAELHLALADAPDDPAFAPQAFTPLDQRSLYQSLRNQLRQTFAMLARSARGSLVLPDQSRAHLAEVLAAQDQIEARYRSLLDEKIAARRIRVHGDFHAGQLLWTGSDVVIIDFEGEPARLLSERRRKRSALVDLAGMIRSFHYAAHGVLVDPALRSNVRARDAAALEPWIDWWFASVAASFLRGYRATAGNAVFVPPTDDEFARLLDAFLLEKAIYELGYELNNRPGWLPIPLRGIRDLLVT